MSTAEAAIPAPAGQAQTPNRPPRRRGPRRGGRGGANSGVASNSNTDSESANPATPAAAQPQPQSQSQSQGSIRGQGEGRGQKAPRGRNGRGRGGGGFGGGNSERGGPLMAGQRAFGGRLTGGVQEEGGVAVGANREGNLTADAPVFVPGQPHVSRTRGRGGHVHPGSHPAPAALQNQSTQHTQHPVQPAQRRRRFSKSQAPDIATRTHEDIAHGQYECLICTSEVYSNQKIWTCKTCWSVIHLKCVKEWATSEGSTARQRIAEGELPPPRQWRCPGCNLPKDVLPKEYTCWCEKEIDPRPIAGLPPHSCGQSCGKGRIGKCPHPCELICHAGPCPPCGHMGPSLSCFCGKEANARRCVDTNYDAGWSCGQICGDLLPCGEHECQRGCHEGLCGSCEVPIESRCFCGRVEKELPCSEREDERESHLKGETWMGSFDCGAECRRPYDCGNLKHFCESTCHPQDLEPAHCPFSPDVVINCPCGKTPISDLLPEPRQDCSAPIPHCQEKCQKVLSCGHLCEQKCHNGDCRPCFQTTQISCRCGRTTSSTVCHQGIEEPPQCPRVCRSTLNCGRHECGERCCPGEKKAAERKSSKKHRALTALRGDENIEPEHICLRVCDRPLKCGNHTCQSLCHKGPCGTCLEAIFEEISCACGRTVLQPPQPCGTSIPSCNFDCTRRTKCGHPQTKHQCHPDTEACPKCPYLVAKPCVCGKKMLKNQPCWFTDSTCGLPCGKKLKCGIHTCQKLCHRQGQCEDATSPCAQPCGRKKTVCEHSCQEKCHAPYPCKEVTPCAAKMFITCACQNEKAPTTCMASKTSPGNSQKSLACTDECLKLQRNAKLAAALNIDPATHLDDHIPYADKTLALYQEYTKFAQLHEREFRVFAADEKEKRIRFKPMPNHQRTFLHALAEDFGLDSESQDPEPHRHVVIFKTPRFVSAPAKTLGQCVRAKPVVAEAVATAPKLAMHSREKWNGYLLADPRFGLTIEEIFSDLSPEISSSGLKFDIHFLPSGDVVLKAGDSGSWISKVESQLISLKPAIEKKISKHSLAKKLILCSIDSSFNVLRKDDDENNSLGGGWSQVAKGGVGGVRKEVPGVGGRSGFAVLGNLKAKKEREEKEKMKVVEEAVDDWETALDDEDKKTDEVQAKGDLDHGKRVASTGTATVDELEPKSNEDAGEGSSKLPSQFPHSEPAIGSEDCRCGECEACKERKKIAEKREADEREIARTSMSPEEREVANERMNSLMHAIGK